MYHLCKHPVVLHRQVEQWPHVSLRVQPLQEGPGHVDDEEQLLLGPHQRAELLPHQIRQRLKYGSCQYGNNAY